MYKRMFVGTEKKERLQKVIRVILPLRMPVNSALLSLGWLLGSSAKRAL